MRHTLHDQFYDPDEAAALTALQRADRRKRRLALIIATAICRAHVAAHGTESEVNLYHHRKPRQAPTRTVTTITITHEEMFD